MVHAAAASGGLGEQERGRQGSAQRILVVYGTRPEAIKMVPVIRALAAEPGLDPVVCCTGQHRELVDQVHQVFGVRPDVDLKLMVPAQDPDKVAAAVLARMPEVLRTVAPSMVLVQGDTTSAMAAALAGFHAGAEVGHVEAGLRSGDLRRPFPEEANRRVIDAISSWMFAPTVRARDALLAEGRPRDRVLLTGNTVVDAVRLVAGTTGPDRGRAREVLVTVHRRESHGAPLRGILRAVVALAAAHPDVRFVFPMHPNPAVREVVRAELQSVPGIDLCEPLSYPDLLAAIRRCALVLTDSGGIQEEAPSFGTPVLVLRDVTERPEGIAAGVARLVGTEPDRIVTTVSALLDDPAARQVMSRAGNPYGDGYAAERIAAALAGRAVPAWEPDGTGEAGSANRTGGVSGPGDARGSAGTAPRVPARTAPRVPADIAPPTPARTAPPASAGSTSPAPASGQDQRDGAQHGPGAPAHLLESAGEPGLPARSTAGER